MNSSPHGGPDKESHQLPVGGKDVPVFSCIVYVTSGPTVRARVANLAGLEVTAPSEREAIAQLVPLFKQRLADFVSADEPIPWVEPPAEMEDSEVQRFIPVHL